MPKMIDPNGAHDQVERVVGQAERGAQKVVDDLRATREASAEQSKTDMRDRHEREREGDRETTGDIKRTTG